MKSSRCRLLLASHIASTRTGSVVMQVKGGKEITLTPGQSFYEGPNDIHTVGRNPSTTIGRGPAEIAAILLPLIPTRGLHQDFRPRGKRAFPGALLRCARPHPMTNAFR